MRGSRDDDRPMLFSEPRGNSPKTGESRAIYDAVIKLRRAGYTVTRGGGDVHLVNGSRTPRRILLEMAGKIR